MSNLYKVVALKPSFRVIHRRPQRRQCRNARYHKLGFVAEDNNNEADWFASNGTCEIFRSRPSRAAMILQELCITVCIMTMAGGGYAVSGVSSPALCYNHLEVVITTAISSIDVIERC